MLDRRKLEILRYVVLDYVSSAEPVGSRTLARKYGLGVSPATIRNEMADLEAMGYLEQPHTSAGRIPSDRGYRLFVDRLMTSELPPADQLKRVRSVFAQAAREIEGLIRMTAQVLSETTDTLSFVQGPARDQVVLRALQVVPIRGRRAILVLVSDEGLVENRLIELPDEISSEELSRISQVLTERLHGMPLHKVRRGLLRDLQVELSRYHRIVDLVLTLLHDDTGGRDEERFYFSGAVNLLRQPEFQDVERAQALLNLLTEQELLADLLGRPGRMAEVRVTIGEENPLSDMHDCSMITATYALGDRTLGQLAVIGPKRMDYGRMVSLVELITRSFSDSLKRTLG